eukprot:Phypoly_transcript_13041.p1 GENE.Phypoly_transcript_13041~~Phypoly_transcript_13041.p1  ORF type:complete len:316 (+),score=37.40 Phypoly_transcript_13041:109-1056(+)
MHKSHKLIAYLFSGQGAQTVGMLKEAVATSSTTREMLEYSQTILKYDILSICTNGPQEVLNQTSICQPALFLSGLSAVEKVRQDIPKCDTVAGLSLGEYTALVNAKVLSFEDGLKLVKLRGEAMQKASEAVPSAMCSIVGCDDAALNKLIAHVLANTKGKLLIANYLGPLHRALSGDTQSIAMAEKVAKPMFGARLCKRLPVSGAFHSEFMRPAMEPLGKAISQARFFKSAVPVICNADGAAHTDSDELKSLLLKQLLSPVRWEESMNYLLGKGYTGFFEMGTGTTLTNLMKNIVSATTNPHVNKNDIETITVSV